MSTDMIWNYQNYHSQVSQRSAIFDPLHRFCRNIDTAMMISKIVWCTFWKFYRIYPPVDGVPTRFQNFLDVKITIGYEQTIFFASFFRRNSILALDSERTHSKIGYPFQDELLMIQLFFYKVRNSKENFGG